MPLPGSLWLQASSEGRQKMRLLSEKGPTPSWAWITANLSLAKDLLSLLSGVCGDNAVFGISLKRLVGDNWWQSNGQVGASSCYVHTGETVKHLYELAPGCFKRLQLVSIGPNWSRSAVSFGSNKVAARWFILVTQRVLMGWCQDRMMVRLGRRGRRSSCSNKRWWASQRGGSQWAIWIKTRAAGNYYLGRVHG